MAAGEWAAGAGLDVLGLGGMLIHGFLGLGGLLGLVGLLGLGALLLLLGGPSGLDGLGLSLALFFVSFVQNELWSCLRESRIRIWNLGLACHQVESR